MASVCDVAKYILNKCGSLSTWKLQKLCYYTQAWTLAWDGKELFPEEFEAWANGPVCRSLFSHHRGEYVITPANFPVGNVDNLTAENKKNIDIVLEYYGDKDPYWLREQTHSEKPWQIARAGYSDGESCAETISKLSMIEYYGGL